MPSVGSTPSTSPAPQQPLQAHVSNLSQSLSIQQVTTMQPTPAGINTAKAVAHIDNDDNDDSSRISSFNSFSSIDTNRTVLNSIATQTQQPPVALGTVGGAAANSENNVHSSKYSQFMIITPAVSIDRNFENTTGASVDHDMDESYFSNGNIFRMTLLQSSIDSGNSSDSSVRSNYNANVHSSRYHLLSKTPSPFYAFSSWRWCTLICAAMRCFGGGHNSNAPYSTSFSRPPYQRSRSSVGNAFARSSTPHRRLRSSSTSDKPFSRFTPRKTRDHMNNITYEL